MYRSHTLLLYLVCLGCGTSATFTPPQTQLVTTGHSVSWVDIQGAWASAAARLREYPVERAVGQTEVWLRFHRSDPLVCAGRPPYYTCTVEGHAPDVFYVEVNLDVFDSFGTSTYELLEHEFMHVLMHRLGAPSTQHHPAMQTSGWVIRRTALYVRPELR